MVFSASQRILSGPGKRTLRTGWVAKRRERGAKLSLRFQTQVEPEGNSFIIDG